MRRPLMQLGIGQLEELFVKSKSSRSVLQQLEHELSYRQVPRAIALLAEVQAAVSGAPSVATKVPLQTSPIPGTPSLLPAELWEVHPSPTYASANPSGLPIAQAHPLPPAVPVDEAYKVLRATPSSTWESIEMTRRQLVEHACPTRVTSLSPEQRAQAQAEARRVNAAYAVLHAIREGQTGTA